jgi:hypothetical protein
VVGKQRRCLAVETVEEGVVSSRHVPRGVDFGVGQGGLVKAGERLQVGRNAAIRGLSALRHALELGDGTFRESIDLTRGGVRRLVQICTSNLARETALQPTTEDTFLPHATHSIRL